MYHDTDQELSNAIFQTLQQALSPDKLLIDQAQQQLKVLQIRPGLLFNYLSTYRY